MSTDQCWNNTDRGKTKFSEKNVSQAAMDGFGIEPTSLL